MATPFTLEDLHELFQETDQLLKEQILESERRFQENERRFRENERRSQEADRRLQETERILKESGQETDRRLRETDRLLKEYAREAERRSQEAERRFQEIERALKQSGQETDRRLRETDRLLDKSRREADHRLRELDKRIGYLTDRLGEFVQEMVAPGAVRLFQARGIDVYQLARDLQAKRHGQALQADLVVSNGQIAVVIEAKSKLSVDDVNEHLERLSRFKTVFPSYCDYQLLGAVAAMVVPENVARYAYRQGLFVLAPQGDMLAILNDDQFQPKSW
jgi:DNA repair exonuclease SbcCD ATPase subunit